MQGIHDPFLVGASVIVAILASFTALDLARSVTSSRGRARTLWLAAGSLAMGFGIWSMHFIGMLAFSVPGLSIAYDVWLLILSIVVAVAASAIALWVASRDRPTLRYFVYGGLAMGAAICGMHYIGMAGVRTAARIDWRWSLVLASILIAIAASFVGLWLAFRFRDVRSTTGHQLRLGAAIVMGVAISGMHYTAMFAAVFVPTGERTLTRASDLVATEGLGVAVMGSTLLILALALLGSLVERALVHRSARADEIAGLYRNAQAEIAERTRIELALREQDERLRLALDAGGMGMWEWDRGGRRLVMSQPCLEMHGLTERFDGRLAAIQGTIHPEDRARVGDAFDELRRSGASYDVEYRIQQDDGSVRWIRSRGRRYDDSSRGPRTIGVCIDVTPQRAMEERLRQSQKLEAIGHLAGGVAHDFNNILTAVQGHVELLLESLAENDPRRADVEEIRRASQRAASLTRQLLAFARRQVLQPRALDLATLVAEMEPMLRRLIGEDIHLATDFQTGATPVRVDPTQVQQIVMNLVVNARDAMPEGGRLSVEVRAARLDAPLDVLSDRLEPGDYAIMSVTDTGSGIPAAVLHRVFEPFYTTKPQGQGTGLGLATVHGIVAQAGGAIRLSSEEGVGSTFEVFLPMCRLDDDARARADDSPAASAAQDAEPKPRPAGHASILVVEDEASVARLIQRALSRRGYDVEVAPSGAEGLEQFARRATFDLVITDVIMPGMSGREMVDRIRASRPDQRVLFISGYTEDALLRKGVDGAEVDFLQKPFTPDDLVQRVAAILGEAGSASKSRSPH